MLAAHLNAKVSELIPSRTDTFAIAFSGGGDSTALVHALKTHPQRGPVFIVDHDLRSKSGAEAKTAKAFAISCGYQTQIFTWQHKAPKTALQEKARRARYGLMGQACRERGIRYLLTAHSRDDQAETLLMRYDNKTDWRGAAGMASISYGPVWPELAQVNICRPLLDISRQDLRDYNRSHKLYWAEDPSNENRNYARIRARDYLANHETLKVNFMTAAQDLRQGIKYEQRKLYAQFEQAKLGQGGEIIFSKFPALELLGLSMRCVGGSPNPIDRRRLALLYQKLKMGDVKTFTFLGAQACLDKGLLILSLSLIHISEPTRPY